MEEGKLVDEWSSRQLKRLLYMTERVSAMPLHPN